MADKFTRSGNAEGDIWYATTASSSKSLESLEDNIDDKLFTHVHDDNTGGSTSSTSETTVVTHTIAANTVRVGILVMAGIRFINTDGSGATKSGTFRLKIGGSTVKTLVLTGWDHGVGSSQNRFGTAFFYWDDTQTWTSEVLVEITAQNADNENTSDVDSFIIIGI